MCFLCYTYKNIISTYRPGEVEVKSNDVVVRVVQIVNPSFQLPIRALHRVPSDSRRRLSWRWWGLLEMGEADLDGRVESRWAVVTIDWRGFVFRITVERNELDLEDSWTGNLKMNTHKTCQIAVQIIVWIYLRFITQGRHFNFFLGAKFFFYFSIPPDLKNWKKTALYM